MRALPALVLALVALAAPGAGLLPPAALAQEPPPPAADTARELVGQLLVAEPSMGDPRFTRTVILIVGQDATGTLGLVINRPYGTAPAADLLRRLGLPTEGAKGSLALNYGGPVQPEIGTVVHSPDYAIDGTHQVAPGLAVTGNPQILADMARGKGPARAIADLGYAGWAPGQLEGELLLKAWAVIPADPDLIFEGDPATRWERAHERVGVPL